MIRKLAFLAASLALACAALYFVRIWACANGFDGATWKACVYLVLS